MESIVRYILKQYLDDYISGLDGSIRCSTSDGVVTLGDLKLRHETLESATDGSSVLEIEGGSIGSLQFKAVRLGKVQVVANNVVFDFNITPIKAILDDTAGSSLKQKMQELWGAGSTLWDSPDKTLGLGPATNTGFVYRDKAQPVYCTVHLEPEDRKRSPAYTVLCNSCKGSMRTNYARCTLCPYCSEKEHKCVICSRPEHEFIRVRPRRGSSQRPGEPSNKSPLLSLGGRQIQQVQPEPVDDRSPYNTEYGHCCDSGEREPEPEDMPLRVAFPQADFSTLRLPADKPASAHAICRGSATRGLVKERWPDKMQL